MPTIECPHCGAQNPDAAEFCEQCGKAVPSSTSAGPRVVSGEAIASTSVGQTVQADLLRKESGKAFGALLVVAVLHVIGGVVYYFLLKRNPQVGPGAAETLLIVNLVLAGIYAGLGFWARANPLPPAIVGLVLFVSVIVFNAVFDPLSLVQGILVKIIVLVVLAKAISSAIKYRRLREQMLTSGATG